MLCAGGDDPVGDIGILLALGRYSKDLSVEETVAGWLTNITVQGNGKSDTIGMAVDGRTFMQGVHAARCNPLLAQS
jgi:hypothetical protein